MSKAFTSASGIKVALDERELTLVARAGTHMARRVLYHVDESGALEWTGITLHFNPPNERAEGALDLALNEAVAHFGIKLRGRP